VDGTSERYDLIVGCDGVDSELRRHMFPDSKPRFCGQVCWRAIVENVTAFSNWHVLLGQNLTLLAVALPNSRLYLYADTTVSDVQHAPESPTALLRRCPPPFAACAAAFEKSDTAYRSPVEEVILDEWHRPNLLLIGDAAHASRPNMAEGAAMALEDAQVLADMLATSAPSEELSKAFVARRRERVDWVQKQTHARDRLRSSPSLIRHTVLRLAAKRLHDRSYSPLRAVV
jgi:2-polyprenyl-6-methoxyphenol hydroxylase-like FAD-dependent oxidoreductase